MELANLKNDWESATNEVKSQTILTPKIITEMTQKKYQSAMNKIKYPELIGSAICIAGLIFIALNFSNLNSILLQAVGVLTVLLLIILPALSFLSVSQFKNINNFDKPYVEIIKQFAKQKLYFLKSQKVNAFLSYLLLVCVIILMPKIFYGKDITLHILYGYSLFQLATYLYKLFQNG